jgi:hypothetical protein
LSLLINVFIAGNIDTARALYHKSTFEQDNVTGNLILGDAPMKNTWKVAVAAAALIGTASVAKADLTLDGQTGLFINPTAEVATKNSPEIQVNYQRLSGYGEHVNQYGIGGAIGLADKLELNGNYERLSASGEHINDWRIGGKYQVLNQKEKGFGLAVGGGYGQIQEYGEHVNHYNLFVAGTKAFNTSSNRAPVEGTLGLRWDRLSAYGESESKFSVYAGAQVPLTRTGEVSLIGEVGSKMFDGLSTPYAIGVRYQPKQSGFNIGAGFGRPSFISQEPGLNSTFFVQAGYQFGK